MLLSSYIFEEIGTFGIRYRPNHTLQRLQLLHEAYFFDKSEYGHYLKDHLGLQRKFIFLILFLSDAQERRE